MDEEVDLLGLSDDALDEDDYNDAVDELDRADESDEQADPSDRRSYRRRRRPLPVTCPPGYKPGKCTKMGRSAYFRTRVCRSRNCHRDTKNKASHYMVLDGKRYRVTPIGSSRRVVRTSSILNMEIGGAKYLVSRTRKRSCRGWRCWLRG